MKKVFLLSLMLCGIALGSSRAQFSLMGEINARGELRNGFKTLRESKPNPAFFVEQRSRLYANYKAKKYELQFTLQDVRIWGANGIVHKNDNGMTAISDGWGRFYFVPKFSIKAGRQMISYDNERMFGGLEWAMQGLRHDALLLMYEDTLGLKVHAGLAYNQSAAVPEPVKLFDVNYPPGSLGAFHATGNYRDMQYLWARKDYKGGFASLYLVNDGRQYGSTSDSISHRQTYGLMGAKKFGGLTLNGEAFYQGGKIAISNLSAYMFSVSATLATKVSPITLGYDHLSGDDPTTETIETFAPLFGTNHKFYGFMDYFYVGNGHSNKGLQDIYLKTKFKLGGGALLVHVHQFLSASDVMDSDLTKVSNSLGTELDLVYVKKFTKDVTFKVGYSQMFASGSMEIIKNRGDANAINNWAWAQLIFKPKFL